MKSYFSIRMKREIAAEQFGYEISARCRGRINRLLHRRNDTLYQTSETGFNYTVSVIEETVVGLKDLYGEDKLPFAQNAKSPFDAFDLFISSAPLYWVMDALEVFFDRIEEQPNKYSYQEELNSIFNEEDFSWRMANGLLFLIDSKFLNEHVLSKSQELMALNGYNGPLEEFEEARKDLAAGDFKGTIFNAGKSFESMLKIVLDESSGNASTLIRKLTGAGFWSDIPAENAKAFEEQVMMSLPTLRNRMGGHGQGKEAVVVPEAYAHLALGLAASFNMFLINKHVGMIPETKEVVEKESPEKFFNFDEIPF